MMVSGERGGDARFDRTEAQEMEIKGLKDDDGQGDSMLSQLFKAIDLSALQYRSSKEIVGRAFEVYFTGEASIDDGGPYRESYDNVCGDIQKPDLLPLTLETENKLNLHGDSRECFILNHNSTKKHHEKMFKQLGWLLGYGIKNEFPMPLDFPPFFWKQIIGEIAQVRERDLADVDIYKSQMLQEIKRSAADLSEEEFDAMYEDYTFVTDVSKSQTVSLIPGGERIKLTKANHEEYIRLVL